MAVNVPAHWLRFFMLLMPNFFYVIADNPDVLPDLEDYVQEQVGMPAPLSSNRTSQIPIM
jgi:hypothetical protein